MQFNPGYDIYMAKKYDEILIACNASRWDIYNSVADTYINMSHQSISPIICFWDVNDPNI